MQLVIDIPERQYQNVIRGRWEGNPLADYIENGIPLPKGHGRLIDADDITQEDKVMDIWIGGYELMVRVKTINNSPTIVEADKAESE